MFQVIFISCYWCLFVCCVFSCKPLHISSEWIWFFLLLPPPNISIRSLTSVVPVSSGPIVHFAGEWLKKKKKNYDFQAENCSFQESNHHLLICSCLISLKTKHCAHGVIITIPTKSLTFFFFFSSPNNFLQRPHFPYSRCHECFNIEFLRFARTQRDECRIR